MSSTRNRFGNLLALVFLAALLISACGGGNGAEESVSDADRVLTQAAEIASSGLTQTAEAAPPTATDTPEPPTPTPTEILPTETEEEVPTNALEGAGTAAAEEGETQSAPESILATPTSPPQSQASEKGCYRANLEYEFPEDGHDVLVGKVFTKTWRLKNVGSCTWRPTFRLVWVNSEIDGDKETELMGTESNIAFTDEEIPPNDYANIEVTYVAPEEVANYRLFYMIRSDDGALFGLGPDGRAWFWIDIETFNPDE